MFLKYIFCIVLILSIGQINLVKSESGQTIKVTSIGKSGSLIWYGFSTSKPTVTWTKDGDKSLSGNCKPKLELKEDGKNGWNFTAILQIEVFRVENFGIYHCSLNGRLRKSFRILDSMYIQRLSFSIGRSALLEYKGSTYTQSISFRWQKQGMPIEDNRMIPEMRVRDNGNGTMQFMATLFISKLQNEDYGLYTCIMMIDHSEMKEKFFLLENPQHPGLPPGYSLTPIDHGSLKRPGGSSLKPLPQQKTKGSASKSSATKSARLVKENPFQQESEKL